MEGKCLRETTALISRGRGARGAMGRLLRRMVWAVGSWVMLRNCVGGWVSGVLSEVGDAAGGWRGGVGRSRWRCC